MVLQGSLPEGVSKLWCTATPITRLVNLSALKSRMETSRPQSRAYAE